MSLKSSKQVVEQFDNFYQKDRELALRWFERIYNKLCALERAHRSLIDRLVNGEQAEFPWDAIDDTKKRKQVQLVFELMHLKKGETPFGYEDLAVKIGDAGRMTLNKAVRLAIGRIPGGYTSEASLYSYCKDHFGCL